jgi:hypothetical protein
MTAARLIFIAALSALALLLAVAWIALASEASQAQKIGAEAAMRGERKELRRSIDYAMMGGSAFLVVGGSRLLALAVASRSMALDCGMLANTGGIDCRRT